MPLILRVAAYTLQGAASSGGSEGQGLASPPATALACVPLWVSESITAHTRAKEAIAGVISATEGRMRAALLKGSLPPPPPPAALVAAAAAGAQTTEKAEPTKSRRKRSFFAPCKKAPLSTGADAVDGALVERNRGSRSPPRTPSRLSKAVSSSSLVRQRKTSQVEWSLCLRDADGRYRLCGDSASRLGESKLIRAPFLTEVAVKSHREFEAARRGAAASNCGDNNIAASLSLVASTAAALHFADEQSVQFAFVSGAMVPTALLREWNGGKKRRFTLYDAVHLPADLQADPMDTAGGDPTADTREPDREHEVRRVRIMEAQHEIDDEAAREGGAIASGEGVDTASPTAVIETNYPTPVASPTNRAALGQLSSDRPVDAAAPMLPLQEGSARGQGDDRGDEGGQEAGGERAGDWENKARRSRRVGRPNADERHSAVKQQHQQRTAQLATHATTLAELGSIAPVPAVAPSELASVWRQPDVRLDGVSEEERQHMIAVEDAARLRLAIALHSYEAARRRYEATSPADAVADGGCDEKAELIHRRASLREELTRNAAAERACEKMTLLIDFYEKEIAASEDRIRRLRSIVQLPT